MKCEICGTENPDSNNYCKKCKRPLNKEFGSSKYALKWKSILIGVIAAAVLLGVSYGFYGASNTFFFGMLAACVVGGCATCISAYNKDIKATDDINPLFNGIVVGLIIGFPVIFIHPVAAILIPGYIMFAFLGGALGFLINVIRQKNVLWLIPFLTIIVLITAFFGNIAYQNSIKAEYDTAFSNQMAPLTFDDLIQNEAEFFLNASAKEPNQKIENLKEAQIRYQRMKTITKSASLWNSKMVNSASSDIEKEYAQVLGQYVNLKLEYYTKMEEGIQLAINGDEKGAQTHYQNAQKLIPKIEHLKNTLTITANKDPQFKQHVDKKLHDSANFIKIHKSENMTFTLLGPD